MLVYIGNGDFIPGIPARNLSDEEIKKHGGEAYLLSTGLWRRPKKTEVLGGRENKLATPGEENKT